MSEPDQWKIWRKERMMYWRYPWVVEHPNGMGFAFETWREAYDFAYEYIRVFGRVG